MSSDALSSAQAAALLEKVTAKADEVWNDCLESATGGDEVLLILQTHHHIREHLEAIVVLLADGLVENCKVHLRVAFEALLTLQYVLEADTVRRAYAWLVVADILERVKTYDKFDPATQVGREFAQKLQDEGHGPADLLDARNSRNRLQSMLETDPNWTEAYHEFKRIKQAKGRVQWYELFGGPTGGGFRGLAYHLNHGAHYEVIYRSWSRRLHGTDVVQRVRPGRAGGINFPSIRNQVALSMVTNFSVSFGLMSSRLLIEYYRPDKWPALKRWYGEDFKPSWPLNAGPLPLDDQP